MPSPLKITLLVLLGVYALFYFVLLCAAVANLIDDWRQY